MARCVGHNLANLPMIGIFWFLYEMSFLKYAEALQVRESLLVVYVTDALRQKSCMPEFVAMVWTLQLPQICDEILSTTKDPCSPSDGMTQTGLRYAAIWLNGDSAPCCRRIGDHEAYGNYFRGTRHSF